MKTENKSSLGSVGLFAILNILCCGIPLLLFSSVSLAFLTPNWPVIGVVLAVVSLVGFV